MQFPKWMTLDGVHLMAVGPLQASKKISVLEGASTVNSHFALIARRDIIRSKGASLTDLTFLIT
jgi:hypothetical protein